ncbi:retinol dehydrogenase 12 [Rhypophila sp. PSN 637]
MAPSLSSSWTQSFPAKPTFTEKDLPDLSGKVYIITGANTGIGKELARILYAQNAKIYLLTRDESKTQTAIQEIQSSSPKSTGSLHHIHLDLSDLASVKTSATKFLASESRLDVLFNNAGYMGPEGAIERTSAGHEIHMGVNCVGTFLLTKLLTPVLLSTASEQKITAKVVYISSFAAELFGEKNTGLDMDNLDYHKDKPAKYRYGVSKLGNWAYSIELCKRYKSQGLIGVAVNPGNIRTELFRQQGAVFRFLTDPVSYPVINGAYSLLFAGLSPEVTVDKAGEYVIPFGRFGAIRADLNAATKEEGEGGNGTTRQFWEWSEEQVKAFL